MTTVSARVDLRLEACNKDRIAKAAALRGMPLSSFVRVAVLREADAAIAADTVVAVSKAESLRLLDALDALIRPNARLKKAVESAGRLTQR